MNRSREQLLAEALHAEVGGVETLSGGDVHGVCRVSVVDGRILVAKFGIHSVLDEEMDGLRALRETRTVRVPEVHALHGSGHDAVLLMESFSSDATADWAGFGRALAALHASPVGDRYGFHRDNHLGPTPQPNGWMDDWIEFNRACRHGPLVDALEERGALRGELLFEVRRALEAFDGILPRHPEPSLLHGDLWSGNALPTESGEIALIDPAPSIGHGLADIAMMQLFGGIPEPCFQGYREASGLRTDEPCLAVYRLHHLLNHLLLFGPGYLGGVRRECALILSEC